MLRKKHAACDALISAADMEPRSPRLVVSVVISKCSAPARQYTPNLSAQARPHLPKIARNGREKRPPERPMARHLLTASILLEDETDANASSAVSDLARPTHLGSARAALQVRTKFIPEVFARAIFSRTPASRGFAVNSVDRFHARISRQG